MTEAASSPSDAAILYDLPSGWTRVKPRSMMRMDPWFFKATGPDATVTAQKDAFLGMLKSIRPNPTAPKAGSF
jgi:hypothetical protein